MEKEGAYENGEEDEEEEENANLSPTFFCATTASCEEAIEVLLSLRAVRNWMGPLLSSSPVRKVLSASPKCFLKHTQIQTYKTE